MKHDIDLIRMGIMKRKLTRKEAAEVTKEVLEMGFNDADSNFAMAIMKSIEKVRT